MIAANKNLQPVKEHYRSQFRLCIPSPLRSPQQFHARRPEIPGSLFGGHGRHLSADGSLCHDSDGREAAGGRGAANNQWVPARRREFSDASGPDFTPPPDVAVRLIGGDNLSLAAMSRLFNSGFCRKRNSDVWFRTIP